MNAIETSCTLETAQGMIEHFGDRAAAKALVLASDATMLSELGSIVLWLGSGIRQAAEGDADRSCGAHYVP